MTAGGLRGTEAEIILNCTRRELDAARVARLRQLACRALDWPFVIRMALRHHIAPLVYQALRQVGAGHVPPSPLEQLSEACAQSARRSHRLLGELLALLRAFADRGIPAVPYKGPVLAVAAYGDVTLRDFRDLDIVVHRRDVMRAKELLVTEGYRPVPHPTAADEWEALEIGYAWQFVRHRDDFAVKVEVHWAFAPRYLQVDLDLDTLTERLEPVDVAGIVLPGLGTEDTLFTLCVHGGKDLWQRLLMICDVAEVIRRPRIRWDRVLDQAARLKRERMLLLGLLLARDLLEAPLPRAVSERLDGDAVAHTLARTVKERLFSEAADPLRPFAFYIPLVTT